MIPWPGNDSRNRRSVEGTRLDGETEEEEEEGWRREDEAGCCARHGTLAPGLESWGPPGTEVHSFIHQPATFLLFLFPSSSLSLSLSFYLFLFPVPFFVFRSMECTVARGRT